MTSTRSSSRHAADALAVEPGLDGHDVPGDERGAVPAEARLLVDVETDAVAERVVEAFEEHLARLLRQLRRVAGVLENVAGDAVNGLALDAGPDRLERAVERLAGEPVPLARLVGRLADDERARHVGVAARLLVEREEVGDHGLAGEDRAGALLVADRGLRAVADDDRVDRGAVRS